MDTQPVGIKRVAASFTRLSPSAPTPVRSAADIRRCPTAEPAIAVCWMACIY